MAPGGVVTLGNPRRPVASPKGGGKELLLPAVGALAMYLLYLTVRRPLCRYLRRLLRFFGIKTRHGPRAHQTNYRRHYRRHGPGRA